MKTITFDIISALKFELDIIKYEKISSEVKWIQKGIKIAEKHFPWIVNYLSKQSILANLCRYKIVIESDRKRSQKYIKKLFSIWIRKERMKRRVFVIIEAILIPFTPILALLPGPNIFFYIPVLFFYYHWKSLKGLNKVELCNLELEVHYVTEDKILKG